MQLRPPDCRSPHHPRDIPRDRMLLVDETATHYCFACVPCKEVNKVLSVQVRVKQRYRQAVASDPRMQDYKRARLVERDPTNGKVVYFR